MLRNLKTILTVILVGVMLIAVYSVSNREDEKTLFALDTYITLSAKGRNAKKSLKEAEKKIIEVEKSISAYDENSDIRTGNLDDISKTVIERGLYFGKISDGAFDITVKPLVELWGINSENPKVPEKSEILKMLEKIDYSKVKTENGKIIMPEGFSIDLGGIGKGYASDLACEILKDAGIDDAVLNLGGNVTVLGEKKIGIQNPFSDSNGEYLGYLEVCDTSVVTSGNYERFFYENGEKYHHIFDTRTGYPANSGVVSVTVISKSAMDADAMSTICFILGIDEGMEFAKKYGYEVMFVTENKEIFKTDGFDFIPTNSEFKINFEKK